MKYNLTRRMAILTFTTLAGLSPIMAQSSKILTVGSSFSPLSMDPSKSGNGRAGVHLAPAYEPLVRTLADGKFAPALAVKWEVSADNKEATFTLREGVKFSDGSALTAEAVKKSIEYFRNSKGPFSANLVTLTDIEVISPLTFKIKLSVPQPSIITLFDGYWLAGYIISPKGLETPDNISKETFGAGGYKLDSAATITGKSYTYIPNEHYYDKSRIKWDKIIITVFEDQNSAIAAMKSGQLKLSISDPFTGNANEKNMTKDMRIISDPVQWSGLILMDRDGVVSPEFKDVRVRQAINHALDRKAISTALFGKYAEPTVQLQGKAFMGYDAENEKRYPFDLNKAKALLAEAGYKDGFEFRMGYVNNSLSVFLSQTIAAQLKKVGITAKLVEYPNFGAFMRAGAAKDYAGLVFNSNSGPPNIAKFQTLMPTGSLNVYGSKDEELTKLMTEASLLPVDKAGDTWKKAYKRVVEMAWFAQVAATHIVYFTHSSIKAPQPGQSVVIDLMDVVPAN